MAPIAVLPLARPTFDVPFAETLLQKALEVLDVSGHAMTGSRTLLMDGADLNAALADLAGQEIERVLILQATFTDAQAAVEISERLSVPVAFWAFPEPRAGGRLRLNSFCGLNLAAHALGLRDIPFGYLYSSPDNAGILPDVSALLAGGRMAMAKETDESAPFRTQQGADLVGSLKDGRIARIGEHPPGFDTCAYDAKRLAGLTGLSVDEIELGQFFEKARAIDDASVISVRDRAEADLDGLDSVDQGELDKSLRLKGALDELRESGTYDAFAIRCWPETFTDYGGAVCGPVSMMGEERVPCACEADMYGAVTSIILQRIANEPVFLFDLVDVDADDNSAVVWHCGQAPISMADPDYHPEATIHTNRKMPLLYQFPLKPGRVTFARLSQARGKQVMVIAAGEVLKAKPAFTGTVGTLRFDAPACDVAEAVIGGGLEHHMALAYGDHSQALRSVAASLNLDILELT